MVVPCIIKTLSGIVNSFTANLLVRAADVTPKEKRKLVLVVRETPFHRGHLRLMTMAADMDAHILPPIPSIYHQSKTNEDIIHQTIGKIFDYLGITHDLFRRWGKPRIQGEGNEVRKTVIRYPVLPVLEATPTCMLLAANLPAAHANFGFRIQSSPTFLLPPIKTVNEVQKASSMGIRVSASRSNRT